MARLLAWTAAALLSASAAEYRSPAEARPAVARPGSPSILPGGRIIAPAGKHYRTAAGSFGLAINRKGNAVATAGYGTNRFTLSVVSRDKEGWHPTQLEGEEARAERRAGMLGVAFEDDNDVYVSEGETGRVVLMDSRTGKVKQTYELNQGEARGSFSGDLAFDPALKRLYALDQANARLVTIDTAAKRILSALPVGRSPFAIALAPGGKRVYVAGLESNSLGVVEVTNPARPELIKEIPTPKPAGLHATEDRIFVSNIHDDAVTVLDAASLAIIARIPLRFAGLEPFRGLLPMGLHYDTASKWLLVACSGINALVVIDMEKRAVLGLIPTAWFPTRVAAKDGTVWVNCAKGYGTGPNASRVGRERLVRHGALLTFALPDASELARYSGTVFGANGFAPKQNPPAPLPGTIEHVVVILKENRSFDEVLGDIESAANGPVAGLPMLAQLGRLGVVNSWRGEFQTRLGLRNISVTPNHHALAQRFAFSDNFYAESETNEEGRSLIAGAFAGVAGVHASLAAPEVGTLWNHLDKHGVSHRRFGEFDMNTPDQVRADRFIQEIEEAYVKPARPLPRFLFLHLPNDHMAESRPGEGYPFPASFVADNDYALGRVVEYLSKSPWWPKMAIFVTEDDALGGLDHIDSHRTLLLAISPYAKRNYVSHTHAGFPGLMKTVLRLLRLPPLNLFDATASDLADCFQAAPQLEPYEAKAVPVEIFEPGNLADRPAPPTELQLH
jgi:DNA-binding beta-propeller fold protein YncE